MPKISVVVPVYNVVDYLPRCIDSILAQTFSDFELILVDDGSTDSCGAICDDYAQKDSRIVIIHKENGGVSKARNAGIDIAVGEYISFVDSDDYIKPDFLETLYNEIIKGDFDCVASGFARKDSFDNTISEWVAVPHIVEFNNNEERMRYIICKVLKGKTGWELWTRLFNASIIKQHNIRMCETCDDFAEDLGFFLAFLLHCKKVISINYIGYCYFQREESMMHNSQNIIRLNEMNELSKWYYALLNNENDKVLLKDFSLVHFFLIYNQLQKANSFKYFHMVPEICQSINDYEWYKKHIKKVVIKPRMLFPFYKKKIVFQYRNLCFYTIHKNYRLFRKISRTYDKFNNCEK